VTDRMDIYIYIYIERERERERESDGGRGGRGGIRIEQCGGAEDNVAVQAGVIC
jgi:hypothetical protein